jgi:methyl-accepting chemotaxis protein
MSEHSPAKPADPQTAPPPDRDDREGSALALRNWRVPWRLIALIAIPTVVAMVFAGLRVGAAAGSAATFGRSAQLAVLGQQITGLAQAMEDERDLTASFVADGRPGDGRAALLKQYAVTDGWARKVRAAMRGVGAAFPAQTRADAAAVLARIADLPDLRSYATASNAPGLAVITNYTLADANMFTFDDDIAQQAGSSALVGSVRALGSLSRMKDQASLQRAILETALVNGQFEPGTLDALISAQAQQVTDLASFETSATLGETQVLNNTVAGPPVDLARALEQRAIVLGNNGGVLSLGPDASRQWYAEMSYTVGKMRLAERQLANSIALQAKTLHQGAMRSLILTSGVALAVLIFVLLATVVIARSMVRPLRRLKAGALEVAEARLPDEVRELSAAGGAGQSVDVEPIGVHSTDEIGQVARAFDQVHQEAVRLAADEARLRGSVSAMFVSLSRRSQSLLERLLRLIDSLELGEQDSERLADLFRMDHLATRMRRNSENLLVLAGQEPPRRWAEPVSLADVARASVSEIEQYDRVVLDMQPGIGVTGNAVADVVHLLAEVIENATTFSAKNTQVTVSGHALRSRGVLINVVDSGMGMTEEQLTQVNWRLENPPPADVEVSRHMGLFAVAHLAARHGVRVRLQKAAAGGLIAHVWLPDTLISKSETTALERIRTARASAVVQAVTRAARFPQDAAAASLTTVPFAAAPLAETPPETGAPGGTAPSAQGPPPGTASPAEAPPGAAPPGEGPPPGTAPPAEALPGTAPPMEAPPAAAWTAEAPQVAVPEASQAAAEPRLPIFESVESDWFRARREPPRRVTIPAVSPRRAARAWISPGDKGWRAAQAVIAPVVGGVTDSGLPRRTPQANLVPGSAGAREARPARPADSAEAMSSRLAGFQRGSRRARAAAPGARPPDEQP